MSGRKRHGVNAEVSFRIARFDSGKSRELAVLETMDCGKSHQGIARLRSPLVLHIFFTTRAGADKLDYAFAGRKVLPLGVAGPIVPWNFPRLMAACGEARAGAACGTTFCLTVGNDFYHALQRPSLQEIGTSRWRRQHRHRRG